MSIALFKVEEHLISEASRLLDLAREMRVQSCLMEVECTEIDDFKEAISAAYRLGIRIYEKGTRPRPAPNATWMQPKGNFNSTQLMLDAAEEVRRQVE